MSERSIAARAGGDKQIAANAAKHVRRRTGTTRKATS